MKIRKNWRCLIGAGMVSTLLFGCGIPLPETNIEQVKVENYSEADIENILSFYGYDSLDENLQKIYRQLLSGIQNYEDEVSVSPCTNEEVNKAFDMILVDHPEIFWLAHQSSVTYEETEDGKILSMKLAFTYTMDKGEIESTKQQIEAAAGEWLSKIPVDADTYGKIKYVYEYLCTNVSYDRESTDNQNIKSVFINRNTVCMGYAKATQYLLNRLGIFCTLVTGKAGVQAEDHAWNLIKIGEQPYYMDTTWGAPGFAEETKMAGGISYTYLCCDDLTLFRTHTPDGNIPLPPCADDSYNYYKMQGCWYDSYDEGALYQAMTDSIWKEESSVSFKFADADSYHQAVQALVNGELTKSAVRDAKMLTPGETYQWNVEYSDEDWLITIYW